MLKLLASATESEHRSAAEIRWQWLVAFVIFCTAFWLYSRHNAFPFYYHPDEPSKVLQVRDGTRNFNHPLLLLTATDWARRVTGVLAECQQIVEVGRTMSALFAATAAAVFSWVGFNRFGLVGGIFTGAVMLVQRRLYEHAHFMKEDASLIVGIALTFVTIDAFWRRPGLLRALLLGAAAAVAASGKYVGLVMLPLAAVVLIARRREAHAQWRLWLALLLGFAAIVAAINHQALASIGSVFNAVGDEIDRLNTRGGMRWSFSPLYWTRTFLEMSPLLLLAFLVHLKRTGQSFRRVPLPDVLMTVFPFVFGFMLSFSSKQSGRHTLPILLVSVFVAALAIIRIAKHLNESGRAPSARRWFVVGLVILFAYDIVRTGLMDRSFRRDHRRELVEWIGANVPPTSVIGVDDRVGVPFGDRDRFCDVRPRIPQEVRGAAFVADLGTLDDVRAAGITHLVVSEARYYAVTNGQAKPSPPPDNRLERRAEFYRRLFNEGRLVWSRETGNVGVLNPGLRVYEIAPAGAAQVP